MKTLSLRAHRGGLKIQPRYRLVLMPRPRRQKTFTARHRRPICSGWNRHSLPGPNQQSSRGHKANLLGAAARLRRGACFIAQTYPSATNVFSPTPDGKTLSGGLQPARCRDPSVPGFASAFVTAQDGLTLHVRRYGSGHASAHSVVCLPGLARTAADFHPLATALAADPANPRLVLALDYRGHGQSQYD